jgi:predicted porin
MKKSLVALAALAFVGAASAQSSVTLFGKANMGFGKTTGGKFEMRNAPDGSDSRFGFRGTEDLGGGLRANFHYEAGLNPETGGFTSANPFQRQSWMGLSGGFGQIRVGRQYTVGFGGSIGYMPSTAVNSQLSVGLGFNGIGSRTDSQFRYISPNMGGATFHFAHNLKGDDTVAPIQTQSMTELGLLYAAGPLEAGITWGKMTGAQRSFGMNAAYNFGAFKLGAGYVDPAGASKGVWLGAFGNMGNFKPWIQMARNTGVKQTAFDFGGYYGLSKRTSVYGVLGRNTTAKVTNFGFGVDHNF